MAGTGTEKNELSAPQAIERLMAGNERFLRGDPPAVLEAGVCFDETCDGQAPFAIVLGCSDSRVPVEIVFDQAFGDLFVIRIAGNIVAPSQIASVEFAATAFNTRLVVVLGHSNCGAITATLDHLRNPGTRPAGSLGSIVRRVQPAVESVMSNSESVDYKTLHGLAVQANIRASVAQLQAGSAILENLMMTEGLMIVGAEYSLEDGTVSFLDDTLPD